MRARDVARVDRLSRFAGANPLGLVIARAIGGFRMREYEYGSNAGGGGGVMIGYANRRDADDAAVVLRALGADARATTARVRRGGRYVPAVEVPDAASVIQREHAGPVDGARWPGADALRRAVSS